MPTYVYRRPDGTTFEVTQRISDDALTVDPETGQPVERVIGGGAGLIFKGTGFYLTDYARKGQSGASGEGSSSGSESKAESAAETKAAPKSDSKSDAKSSAASESPSKTKSD
jgi:predicted nucleic acid-binding Zn ribbon protein